MPRSYVMVGSIQFSCNRNVMIVHEFISIHYLWDPWTSKLKSYSCNKPQWWKASPADVWTEPTKKNTYLGELQRIYGMKLTEESKSNGLSYNLCLPFNNKKKSIWIVYMSPCKSIFSWITPRKIMDEYHEWKGLIN